MALNPSGSTLVTGAGDETLRFWNLGYRDRSEGKDGGEGGFLG